MDPRTLPSDDQQLENAMAYLLNTLPKPLQDFLLSDERNQIALSLSQKYGLHVDQAGEFERGFLYLLMGSITPGEFASMLETAGISKESTMGLMADVNEQVFKRLRDAEKLQQHSAVSAPDIQRSNAVDAILAAPAPIAPPAPVPLIPAAELVTPQPATTAPLYATPTVPQRVTLPTPTPVYTPQAATVPAYSEHSSMRTMATDMQAVKENRPAMPVFEQVAVTQVASTTVTTAPIPVAQPVMETSGKTAPAPVNLPGAPMIKQYGVDPYREAIQ